MTAGYGNLIEINLEAEEIPFAVDVNLANLNILNIGVCIDSFAGYLPISMSYLIYNYNDLLTNKTIVLNKNEVIEFEQRYPNLRLLYTKLKDLGFVDIERLRKAVYLSHDPPVNKSKQRHDYIVNDRVIYFMTVIKVLKDSDYASNLRLLIESERATFGVTLNEVNVINEGNISIKYSATSGAAFKIIYNPLYMKFGLIRNNAIDKPMKMILQCIDAMQIENHKFNVMLETISNINKQARGLLNEHKRILEMKRRGQQVENFDWQTNLRKIANDFAIPVVPRQAIGQNDHISLELPPLPEEIPKIITVPVYLPQRNASYEIKEFTQEYADEDWSYNMSEDSDIAEINTFYSGSYF